MYEDAQKLFNCEDVETHLKYQETFLVFDYIDKGVWILGVRLPQFDIGGTYVDFNTSIKKLMDAKTVWNKEVRDLQLDLTVINVAQMEENPIRVLHPEPYLIRT